MDSRDKQRALWEGWAALQGNIFWQQFHDMMLRKNEYLVSGFTQAKTWEDVCRLQGELMLLRQLILLAQEPEKGVTE